MCKGSRVQHAFGLKHDDLITSDVVQTIMVETKSMLNSRFLTYVADVAYSDEPVTPNHLSDAEALQFTATRCLFINHASILQSFENRTAAYESRLETPS